MMTSQSMLILLNIEKKMLIFDFLEKFIYLFYVSPFLKIIISLKTNQ